MPSSNRAKLQKLLASADRTRGGTEDECRTAAMLACQILREHPELLAAGSNGSASADCAARWTAWTHKQNEILRGENARLRAMVAELGNQVDALRRSFRLVAQRPRPAVKERQDSGKDGPSV